MSDYLWDKTGEPDAETERIENLLGQLRFQPTPFDLPAELPARESRAPRARVLSWPRVALAASLTLAVLAGAWLVLKQQTGTTNDGRQVATQNKQTDAGEKHSTAAVPKATEATNENNAGEKKEGETPSVVPSQGNETRREERAAARRPPRLPDLANNAPRRAPRAVASRTNRTESARAPKRREILTPPDKSARREETAALTEFTAEEREAAEKVLYALRVTSEKLNYARRQVRGPGRGEDNR